MFADDTDLVGNNQTEVNQRLDEWKLVLEGREQVIDVTRRVMSISGDTVDEIKSFKYLEYFVQKNDDFDASVNHSFNF